MALTRSFKETVKARVDADPEFGILLLEAAVQLMLEGDLDTGKVVLSDYINSTIGFENLAKGSGIPVKSLYEMFEPDGSPEARNLFAVVAYLEQEAGLQLQVSAVKQSIGTEQEFRTH